MPDRDYYLSNDPKLAETKTKYLQHLANVLNLAGEKNAAASAKAILDFETKIAQVHWTKTESRDATKTYNKMTLAELAKLAPGFDFRTCSRTPERTSISVIVAQPSAVKGMGGCSAARRFGAQGPTARPLARRLCGLSAAGVRQGTVRLLRHDLYGTPEQEVRWKRGVNFTVGALGDDVSKLYVAKFFPPETKAAADQLVQNVIAAMDRRIDKLDWMSAETKAKAHAKLAAFTPKIGYPSQWRDMSGLRSTAATSSGTPCARLGSSMTMRSASSVGRSAAGNGA